MTTSSTITDRSSKVPPPIPSSSRNRQKRTLALCGVWIGGFFSLGPIYGLVGTIVGMLSTFGEISEGGDVAAAAAEITGGVSLALRSTQIGFGMLLIGLPILVPSLLTLSRMKKETKAANQALQTTSVTPVAFEKVSERDRPQRGV